jgi:hypothetical protein
MGRELTAIAQRLPTSSTPAVYRLSRSLTSSADVTEATSLSAQPEQRFCGEAREDDIPEVDRTAGVARKASRRNIANYSGMTFHLRRRHSR